MKRQKRKDTLEVEKKNVLIFSSVHVWSDTRIYNKEAMSLVKQGWHVDLVAVEGTELMKKLPDFLTVRTLPKGSKLSRLKRWWKLYIIVLKSNAAIYHFHDPELLFLVPIIKRKKTSSQLIFDMHELMPAMLLTKEWIPKLLRRPMSNCAKWLEKKWLPLCDAIIFAEKSYCQHYPQLVGKTVEILNYPLWETNITKKKEEVFTFIYVGDIVIDRGIMTMLTLMKTLKNRGHHLIHLSLIGPISTKLKKQVLDFIKLNGLTDIVVLHGRIPYKEIWEHYASADIGLCLLHPIPNYQQSLATKLFEYMAAGLPILATDIPMWEDLIRDTDTGLTVNNWNDMDVADKAEALMNDANMRLRFSINGRREFDTTYNWRTEEIKLFELYNKLEKCSNVDSSD
ncbi:glycosyltransferase family 4 protein [Carnobacterium maltaromaticum]|uniref:glycosyltransferase family 4 protein n=1 Tax=Carnobacterium maltaromaticum TaxID=2751 RepID=UPI00191BAA31|nr:glycosyltransferase family 4 protein [Carnobacterium maltaromaticum]CAD5902906.1 Capsular biosynthesis protein [Carnobacterium maltaromaticum]